MSPRSLEGAHAARPRTPRAHRLRVPVAALVAVGCNAAEPAPLPAPASPETRALPAPDRTGGLPLFEAIAARRSIRDLGGRAPTDAQLGQLLWSTQGITDDAGHRAAPSAGALYPLTVYVVEAGGVWRYVPDDHALVRALAGDRRGAVAAAGFDQDVLDDAPAIVVVAARESITARKYRGRAARYVALEAGHAAQGFLLAAASLGLASVPIGAFDDADVRDALDLADDVTPLYLLPVGTPR